MQITNLSAQYYGIIWRIEQITLVPLKVILLSQPDPWHTHMHLLCNGTGASDQCTTYVHTHLHMHYIHTYYASKCSSLGWTKLIGGLSLSLTAFEHYYEFKQIKFNFNRCLNWKWLRFSFTYIPIYIRAALPPYVSRLCNSCGMTTTHTYTSLYV